MRKKLVMKMENFYEKIMMFEKLIRMGFSKEILYNIFRHRCYSNSTMLKSIILIKFFFRLCFQKYKNRKIIKFYTILISIISNNKRNLFKELKKYYSTVKNAALIQKFTRQYVKKLQNLKKIQCFIKGSLVKLRSTRKRLNVLNFFKISNSITMSIAFRYCVVRLSKFIRYNLL